MAQTLRVTLIKPGTIVPKHHYGPYSFYCGLHVVTELSSTKAISTVYKNRFNTSTRYLGYQAMGWNDKNILETLKQDI
ncbi:hypothetical protein RhiirA5_406712 [Rhizophagus irregularis]|uniref:Uncharacterized protein n=1 Tax=Rhizophagus irregularis TaxID=588596 RepID=A0A2N0QCA2_9GLOM|nr:hypothetical protein RhiirA5_406712 [Rhizophagus irregularis]